MALRSLAVLSLALAVGACSTVEGLVSTVYPLTAETAATAPTTIAPAAVPAANATEVPELTLADLARMTPEAMETACWNHLGPLTVSPPWSHPDQAWLTRLRFGDDTPSGSGQESVKNRCLTAMSRIVVRFEPDHPPSPAPDSSAAWTTSAPSIDTPSDTPALE